MLKNVVYLKEEDYIKLKTNGTAEINGQTVTYSDNDIYMTPDDTDEKLAAMETKIYKLGLNVGKKIYEHTITFTYEPDQYGFEPLFEIIFYSFRKNTDSVMYCDNYEIDINPTGVISVPFGADNGIVAGSSASTPAISESDKPYYCFKFHMSDFPSILEDAVLLSVEETYVEV